MLTLPISQMDIGPMVPGICALTGFVIIPVTLVACALSLRRKTRTAPTIGFTVCATPLFIVWLAGLVDLHYEPIDDITAESAVTDLPEVKMFLAGKPGPLSAFRDAEALGGPSNESAYDVTAADFDHKGQPYLVWHVFRVSAMTREIQVLGPDKNWESLQAWRATSNH